MNQINVYFDDFQSLKDIMREPKYASVNDASFGQAFGDNNSDALSLKTNILPKTSNPEIGALIEELRDDIHPEESEFSGE